MPQVRANGPPRPENPEESRLWSISLWMSLLSVVGTKSELFSSVAESPQRTMHCARVLDAFAPSTVLKYLTTVRHFFKLCEDMKVQLFDMTALQMTDILIEIFADIGSSMVHF